MFKKKLYKEFKKVGTPSQSEHSGLGVKSKSSVSGKQLHILLTSQNVCIQTNAFKFLLLFVLFEKILTQGCHDIFLYF